MSTTNDACNVMFYVLGLQRMYYVYVLCIRSLHLTHFSLSLTIFYGTECEISHPLSDKENTQWRSPYQLVERERESIIFSIQQYPLNSIIIFWKHHNILERCLFGTRKHIEVGLNFSLAAGPKRLCLCFCFFELSSICFCWTDSDVRQTDIYFSEVCFISFLCILGC